VHSLPQTNIYGSGALVGGDFSKPDTSGEYSFWHHVDYAVKTAEQLGLYIGLLPVWGSMVKSEKLNMGNVKHYARFLGERYKNCPNIIWIMGGDVRGCDGFEVWNTMAQTIKEISPDKLMCFHPFGRTSSSNWFNQQPWLDINMFQSGHRRYDQRALNSWDDLSRADEWYGEDNWRYVLHNHSLEPLKPVLDAEPSYEGIPQGLHDPAQPRWQDYDVRRYAYWSVFAGACGFTYGNNSVMQFYKNGFNPSYGANEYWDEAIHHPGSAQIPILKQLIELFPYYDGAPAQNMLAGGEGEKYERISVFAGDDYALFYNYSGRAFAVNMGMISGEKVNAWWFDPSNGKFSFAGVFANSGTISFAPAKRYSGQNDTVLVLFDIKADYIK